MEPPAASVPSATPMTPFTPLLSAAGNHGNSDLGSSTPLTVPNYSIQPLSSINTSSVHSNFSSGSSPLGSPLTGVGVPLSPHGNTGSMFISLCGSPLTVCIMISDGSPSTKPPGAAGSPMTGRREVSTDTLYM